MRVGDYVRTKDGIIGKIIDKNMAEVDDRYELDYNNKLYYYKQIAKSSPNIIDLIEVGDFVNGEQIMDIRNDDNINNETLLYYYIPSDYGEDCFRNKDIKSIVAKEQFESMEYKIYE